MFLENRGQAFGVWREPFVELQVPLLFNLAAIRSRKMEHDANAYNDWFLDGAFVMVDPGVGGAVPDGRGGLFQPSRTQVLQYEHDL